MFSEKLKILFEIVIRMGFVFKKTTGVPYECDIA